MISLLKFSLQVFVIVACVAADFNLTVLHTNDVHARFEEANKYGGSCSSSDAQSGKCFGGVARRATMINKIKSERSNVLLLDAGDQFQGTLWFYVYKGLACSNFMNQLGYSAMVSINSVPLPLQQQNFYMSTVKTFLHSQYNIFNVLNCNL